MKIYCCQTDIAWENKTANHKRVRQLLADAEPEPGSLVLLPEMFSTGFSMNVVTIHEGERRETELFLIQLAKDLGVYMVGGVVNCAATLSGCNQAVVFGPDGHQLTRYTKMQPFSLGGEAKHYTAGAEPVFFSWHDFKVSPFICYDLRFPELFREAVRQGAQLFVVIANWPVTRIHHWVTLLQARAIENLAYVAGVNRCGADPKYTYNGHSIIVDPHGKILADAGDGEKVISAEVDPHLVEQWRNEFPALQDMRQPAP